MYLSVICHSDNVWVSLHINNFNIQNHSISHDFLPHVSSTSFPHSSTGRNQPPRNLPHRSSRSPSAQTVRVRAFSHLGQCDGPQLIQVWHSCMAEWRVGSRRDGLRLHVQLVVFVLATTFVAAHHGHSDHVSKGIRGCVRFLI